MGVKLFSNTRLRGNTAAIIKLQYVVERKKSEKGSSQSVYSNTEKRNFSTKEALGEKWPFFTQRFAVNADDDGWGQRGDDSSSLRRGLGSRGRWVSLRPRPIPSHWKSLRHRRQHRSGSSSSSCLCTRSVSSFYRPQGKCASDAVCMRIVWFAFLVTRADFVKPTCLKRSIFYHLMESAHVLLRQLVFVAKRFSWITKCT